MQTDDDFQTTLSKWPFIAGDALLVVTALTIGILGDWNLTNWQVAACVISVALGAALFALPYVIEYQVRVREEREDRTAELRLIKRHLAEAESGVESLEERLEAMERAVDGVRRAVDAVPQGNDWSEPVRAMERRIEETLDRLGKLEAGNQSDLERLRVEITRLEKVAEAKPGDDVVGEVAELRKDIEGLRADFQIMGSPPEPPTVQGSEVSPPEDSNFENAEGGSILPPEHKVVVERPERSPRVRRSPEPRLLKRAIEEKRDRSSSAVGRIIDGQRVVASETGAPAEADSEVDVGVREADLPDEEGLSVDVAITELEAGGDGGFVEADSDEEETELPENPGKSAAKDEPVAEIDEVAEAVEVAEASTPDMFADTVPPQPAGVRRIKKKDTAVIASVFIGIGNKPYVRGSGAGLNWERGISMEFEEIGKWCWIAPSDLEASIEIQLYRNDEDADRTGKHVLEPGQQLEVSPVF